MKLIERSECLSKLSLLIDTPDIKVITGVRRSGKSKLMDRFRRELAARKPKANIIYIDLVLFKNKKLLTHQALHDYVEKKRVRGKNYLFIDEVQLCEGFEKAINSLHASERYDIYLTGSNAFLLSSDLATLFTGRTMQVHVMPFSFAEYRKYFSREKDMQTLFDRYMVEGGFSGSYIYPTAELKAEYIREVYSTIITRDLVQKYNLPDSMVLDQVARFMMDNVSNISTPYGISTTLKADRTDVSHVTVANYLHHLCDAYLLYEVRRYDLKGKKYLSSQSKYYLCDCGMRFALLGRRNMDWGRVFENMVFLELHRRGYDVYVGKLYEKEIDFVAQRGDEKLYIQVSDDISEPKTLNRETEPLLKIRDAYPKFLITRTRHEAYDYHGIKIVDLASWLLTPPGSVPSVW